MSSPTSYKTRFDYTIKVLVLGDHSVGKSTLLSEMAHRYDSPCKSSNARCINYRPNCHTEMDIPRCGKRVLTRIVDTGGQERFRSITASFYRGAQGCLLMFDAENSDTFMNIHKWHEDLENYANTQTMSTFLVGINTDSNNRQVSCDQAEQLASQLGMQYHEVKAKSRHTLLEVVQQLLDVILIHASRVPSITLDIHPLTLLKQQSSSGDPEKKKFNCAC